MYYRLIEFNINLLYFTFLMTDYLLIALIPHKYPPIKFSLHLFEYASGKKGFIAVIHVLTWANEVDGESHGTFKSDLWDTD